MEHCGMNCPRAVTNGGLWIKMSEGGKQWRILDVHV